MLKAFMLGILASFFFAATFVLNRQMGISGGHWIWSSALRFWFMLPILFALLIPGRRYQAVFAEILRDKARWFLWSTIGFGVFYSCLCAASAYGPSWLIASTWQLTIVAGALLSPLFYMLEPDAPEGSSRRNKIPRRQVAVSLVILAGVGLVQLHGGDGISLSDAVLGAALVSAAAFAYPLGNRKMMEIAGGRLNTLERVAGMTLCSMPFWLLLSMLGLFMGVVPTRAQYIQTLAVALFSGVVATLLFFKATDLVRGDPKALAIVESTQAGEVVFALLGGILVSGDRAPGSIGYIGIIIIVAGLVINGLPQRRTPMNGS